MRALESALQQCLQAFWSFCYYCFLLMFATGIWAVNILALVLALALPKKAARRGLRGVIHWLMRFYLSLEEQSGALRCNRALLEGIAPEGTGRLIVANHPSMLDAPIFLSLIPGLVCVFKSALKQSLLMPLTARTAGYLSNDDGLQMQRDLEAALKAGERVLLFPEGTRTSSPILNKLNPGYALAALRAGVPVQLVAVRSNSMVLSKRQQFLRTVNFPAVFDLALGPLIEPGDFLTVRQMNAFVENWFRRRLGHPGPIALSYLPANALVTAWQSTRSCTFRVPRDPSYCRGHMPEEPLVPAFVQMAWAREIIIGDHPGGGEIAYHRWKFLQPIRPGDTVQFQAQAKGEAWICTFTKEDTRLAQGRLLLQDCQPAAP